MKSGQKRRKHNTGLCRSRRWLRRRRLILQALDVDFAPGTGRQKDQLLGPRPTRLASPEPLLMALSCQPAAAFCHP